MFNDLRYAMRMLLRNPGFTVVAVLTLALGIGANTAIFSVVNAVLIRPMPYHEPDRLVAIHQTDLKKGWKFVPPSPADFLDWREQNQVFDGIAAFRVWFHSLAGSDGAENVLGVRASANFFRVLGVSAAHGRTFLTEEDQPGRDQVVLLTHGLWQRRFGSDPQSGKLSRSMISHSLLSGSCLLSSASCSSFAAANLNFGCLWLLNAAI
jgi:putative ABC transport system permease protein